MKVVDIVNGKVLVHEVPDSYIRCSVTGTFLPQEEFMRDGVVVRTNGEASYHMPTEEFQSTSERTKLIKMSREFRYAQEELNAEKYVEEAAISVEEMITALQKLPAGSRLIVTQDGYYADGGIADIFTPEASRQYANTFVIGHSSQNY